VNFADSKMTKSDQKLVTVRISLSRLCNGMLSNKELDKKHTFCVLGKALHDCGVDANDMLFCRDVFIHSKNANTKKLRRYIAPVKTNYSSHNDYRLTRLGVAVANCSDRMSRELNRIDWDVCPKSVKRKKARVLLTKTRKEMRRLGIRLVVAKE